MSIELERMWSPEPVRAVKQYFMHYGNDHYSALALGHGHYNVGETHAATHLVRGVDAGNCRVCGMNWHDIEPCGDLTVGKCFNHGFYAWKSVESLPTLREMNFALLITHTRWLHVELSGIVVEHEHGYRASRQRIIREFEDSEVEEFAAFVRQARWTEIERLAEL